MGIISWIIVGLIAGWLAGIVVKGSGYGVVGEIILGIVGAVVGGFLATTVFRVGTVDGINLESIVIATVGAVIVVAASRLVMGRNRSL